MKILSNDRITIRVSEHGAELCSLISNKTGREYLWQADPIFWKRHSPVLFPIVGGLWDNTYRNEGKKFSLSQHGFARDLDFKLKSETKNEIWYFLESNTETKERYPFDFMLEIGYRIKGNAVEVMWNVKNPGIRTLYFQIGAHPAFYYQDYDIEKNERGYLQFDEREGLEYILITEKGCVSPELHPLKLTNGVLPLDVHTFDEDAIILENNQIRKVCLLNKDCMPYLSLSFTAPVLGLWSPPTKNAPFICIEPWYGRCDSIHYTGEFKNKDWMQSLLPGEVFEASYSIEVLE